MKMYRYPAAFVSLVIALALVLSSALSSVPASATSLLQGTLTSSDFVYVYLPYVAKQYPPPPTTPTDNLQTTTPVCGSINTDTTWLLINSPYNVCVGGVSIGPTATLTIQPGVTVQFENSRFNKLNVNYGAALIAIGTLTQPITFTGVVATPGSWGGISAVATYTPSLINLSYVTLDYGGEYDLRYGAQLYANNAVVTITHSLIRNGGSHGVYAESNARVDIHDTSFISNRRNAIQLNQPSNRDILMSGLSASDNGLNAVFIAGSTQMNGQRRWAFTGIP